MVRGRPSIAARGVGLEVALAASLLGCGPSIQPGDGEGMELFTCEPGALCE